MRIMINMDLLTIQAKEDIEFCRDEKMVSVSGKPWLMGIKLPNDQTVATYPISGINPLAPPYFYIVDVNCEGIHNREYPSKIVKHLRKWCDDETLPAAVKALRGSIKILSKGV